MENVKPKGKLGILIPGMGAVASTFIAGVEAIKLGKSNLLEVCHRWERFG